MMLLFRRNVFRNASIIFFVTIAAAIILKRFFIGAVCVPTPSMEPALLPGDFILINKMVTSTNSAISLSSKLTSFSFFGFPPIGNLERGDVLLFELPDINNVVPKTPLFFLKRCIGLPGDTITVTVNEVFVNNKKIKFPSWSSKSDSMGFGSIIVPRKGFVAYINQRNYNDWAGLIKDEGHRIEREMDKIFIDGIPAKSYTIEQDYLFVLGDNIQHSYDSRHWGFLNQDNVVGKAMVIYWSISPQKYVQKFSEYFRSIRWDRIGSFIR